MLGKLRSDLGRDGLLSGMHLADDRHQIPWRHVLQDVASRPGGESTLNLDVPLKRRQQNDSSIWKIVPNCDHGVDAADVRKPEIHQGDIRTLQAETLDSVPA